MTGEHFDAGARFGLCRAADLRFLRFRWSALRTVARNATGHAVRDVVFASAKPLPAVWPASEHEISVHNRFVKLLRLLKGLHSLQVLGASSIFVVSDHLKNSGFCRQR